MFLRDPCFPAVCRPPFGVRCRPTWVAGSTCRCVLLGVGALFGPYFDAPINIYPYLRELGDDIGRVCSTSYHSDMFTKVQVFGNSASTFHLPSQPQRAARNGSSPFGARLPSLKHTPCPITPSPPSHSTPGLSQEHHFRPGGLPVRQGLRNFPPLRG